MSRKFKERYELAAGYPYIWDRIKRKATPDGDVVGMVSDAGTAVKLKVPRFCRHDKPHPRFRLVLELETQWPPLT